MSHASRQKREFLLSQVMPRLKDIPSLKRLYLYGSVAKGRARPGSDIDLAAVCQAGYLHLCRFQLNWRLWRAGWRKKISIGVVVIESIINDQNLTNDDERYFARWLNSRHARLILRCQLNRHENRRLLNLLAKRFFKFRFFIDRQRSYPNPFIRLTDRLFCHFGNSQPIKEFQ